jgi:hypothetical protein
MLQMQPWLLIHSTAAAAAESQPAAHHMLTLTSAYSCVLGAAATCLCWVVRVSDDVLCTHSLQAAQQQEAGRLMLKCIAAAAWILSTREEGQPVAM